MTYWIISFENPSGKSTHIVELFGEFLTWSNMVELSGPDAVILFIKQITKKQYEIFIATKPK